jgi:hypothetical protein
MHEVCEKKACLYPKSVRGENEIRGEISDLNASRQEEASSPIVLTPTLDEQSTRCSLCHKHISAAAEAEMMQLQAASEIENEERIRRRN